MENYSMEFKRALKANRNYIKSMIKENAEKQEAIYQSISLPADEIRALIDLNILSSADFTVPKKMQFRAKTKKKLGEAHLDALKKVETAEDLSLCNAMLDNLVKEIQKVINVYNNDRVTKSVDFSLLFMLMESIRIRNLASSEALAAAFGMNVCAAITEYQKGNTDILFIDYILYFGEFYNADGSFKYSTDEVGYLEKLTELCGIINADVSFPVPFAAVNPKIAMDFTKALMASNVKYFANTVKKFGSMKVNRTPVETVSYANLAALKEYYRDGEIVRIPENMVHFKQILNDCRLDEKEQTFILGLVNKKIAEQNEDINLRVLKGDNLEEYIKAKQIMETLHYTDPSYHLMVQAFQALTMTSRRILECGETEDLLIDQAEYMTFVIEFNQEHLGFSYISKNNLILLGDYFSSDFADLTNDKKDRVLDVLSRISVDNKARFRRVLTGENTSFIPYEIIAKNIQISFVEVDTGIFVLLACSEDDSIYRKTVNRLIKEDENLNIIATDVKDTARRNDVLLESEIRLVNLKGESRK